MKTPMKEMMVVFTEDMSSALHQEGQGLVIGDALCCSLGGADVMLIREQENGFSSPYGRGNPANESRPASQ